MLTSIVSWSSSLTLVLLLLQQQVQALTNTRSSCSLACTQLSHILPPTLTIPSPNASLPLWSNFQAQTHPICRVEPRDANDVAVILDVLKRFQCRFAVLGGGTSPFKGASMADDGVTIDLRRMKGVEMVDGGDGLVRVGAGCLWADVYRVLERWGRSATGTRNSLTGVVGSILGGGISFFSERHGWACDMVVEFELVLANSSIVTASETVNPDLFWALKGGGNNFGVVTQVTIETFPDPPRWYTFQLFDMLDLATVFDRLERHTAQMPSHVWQIATTLGWHVAGQHFVISERMVASERPELVKNVSRSEHDGTGKQFPVIQTNVYERSILNMAQKMDVMNAYGFFNFFGTTTVRSNARVFMALAQVFQEEVAQIKDAADLQVYIVYNPVTLNVLSQMKKHGGNALGLSGGSDPLTVVNINLHWSAASDEPRMRTFMRRTIGRFAHAATEKNNMLHPYLFQNHAFEEQDVFAGYGEWNLARLRAVRHAVDPDGLFQTLQPGFFKLESVSSDGDDDDDDDDEWVKSEL